MEYITVIHKLDDQLDGHLQYALKLLAQERVTEDDIALMRSSLRRLRRLAAKARALDEKTP
jgi:hypothetical protein